jgi:hypothetical protein
MVMNDGTRRSHRIRTWFETHFSSQRQEGEGVLTDISYTGARLEDTSIQPRLGAPTVLYVSLPDDSKPFQVEGTVTRHTDTGFAIDFKDQDECVRTGVDRVARLVEPSLETDGEAEPDRSQDDEAESDPIEIDVDVDVDDADLTVTRPRLEDVQDPVAETAQDAAAETARGPREIELGSHSLPELETLAEKIATEIATRRDEAKQRVREEIEQMAKREGFSLEELLEFGGEDGSET